MKIDKQPSCSTAVEPGVITVPEAVSNILNKITPITDFSKLHIRQCLKRIVFEDIKSPIDVPGFNNSAMDGYAVSSDDLPIGQSKTFTIVGTAFAGNPFTGNCGHNECVRIMTGAMVPEQADTIVIQEDIQLLDSTSIEIGSGHNKN